MAILQFRKPREEAEEYYDPEEYYTEEVYEEEAYPEDAPSDREDYTERIRRHRRAVVIRTVVLTLLMIGMVSFVAYRVDTRVFSGAEISQVSPLVRSSSSIFKNLGGNVFSYSRDGASCMDPDGKPIWNITYEMQQPMIDIEGNTAAIADYNGSKVYVVTSEKTLGTVTTLMPIRAISVSRSGEVAAVLADSNVTWVYLYAADGTEIAYFRMSMNRTGYPVSVSISPGGEMVCISYLRADGTDVKSSVAFYNFGSIGQNEIDNYVSGFDYRDEIVPYVRFISDTASFAVSDERIAFFTGRQIPQAGENIFFKENLLSVYSSDKYVALLFPDSSGVEQYRLDIYNARGDKITTIPFTMDFTDIQIAYDRIYISDEQSGKIFDVDGTQKFSGAFGKSIDALIPGSRIDKITVITTDGLERLTLN
ncbi:MAG: hypothetical protein J6I56_00895 [Lachnospiraceae bacterium]|nr:hypothetical protein [Lachnospiraceae bacterium]